MKIEDENIYYQNKTGEILSEDDWKIRFDQLNDPCKWYNDCEEGICEHPNHFCPKPSGLKEVRHYALDEEGSLMWEEV